MQNLKYVSMKRRGVMTEQNRSSFAVVTFYTTSALVTALQFSSPAPPSPTWSPNQLNSVPFLRCAYRGTNFPSNTESFPAGAHRNFPPEYRAAQTHSAR